MHEHEEAVVALDEVQHLIGGSPESGIAGHRAHERIGQRGPDRVRDVTRLTDNQEQRAQVAVILGGQRVENLTELSSWLVDDHDGHDRGYEFGVEVHEEARLAGLAC